MWQSMRGQVSIYVRLIRLASRASCVAAARHRHVNKKLNFMFEFDIQVRQPRDS